MTVVRKSCLAVVAVLLLGGCAESDDALSSAKRSVAEQANPICEETREKVGELGDDPAADRDAVQSAADRLKALPVPGDDEAIYKVFQVRVQNMALALEDLAQSRLVENPDPGRASTALDRASQSNEEVKKAAADYGLVECSQGLAS